MTYEKIKPYIEKKLISEQTHPENPDVKIFNYTQHCQFEKAWDEVTMQCRGLIMNVVTAEIIARPFPKFFNYQEHIQNPKAAPIPDELPLITEKMDGSLGILYALDRVPYIATRGSFTSDQAQWATKWWRDKIGMLPEKGETHLFEIIYPENRIVVNYDFSGLVHLATLDTGTGKHLARFWYPPVRSVEKIEVKNIEQLAKMDVPNGEGFVIHYPSNDLRLKIKFPEYVRLHKIVTGVSEIGIWEQLRAGKNLNELLDKVPDEFFKWVQGVENRLRAEWATIWGEAQFARQMVGGMDRKDQALTIMKNNKRVSSVVFSLLDGQDKRASDNVWRMIRPHGQKQFKVDIDQ